MKVYIATQDGTLSLIEKTRLLKWTKGNLEAMPRGDRDVEGVIASCDAVFFGEHVVTERQRFEEEIARRLGIGILKTDAPIKRIRRITGYLVSGLERFGAAKRAEERMRVKHYWEEVDHVSTSSGDM